MLILRKVWSYEMSNEQVVEDLDLISSIKFPARDQTENIVQQLKNGQRYDRGVL